MQRCFSVNIVNQQPVNASITEMMLGENHHTEGESNEGRGVGVGGWGWKSVIYELCRLSVALPRETRETEGRQFTKWKVLSVVVTMETE